MLLRIVETPKNEVFILYSDGRHSSISDSRLKEIFDNIGSVDTFSGEIDGWELDYDTMDLFPGKTLAWIDDDHILHITENNPFSSIVGEPTVAATNDGDVIDYLTVDEYAEEVERTAVRIRVLCREGRIPGAVLKGKRWLIPKGTPFPADNRFVETPKRPRRPKKIDGGAEK